MIHLIIARAIDRSFKLKIELASWSEKFLLAHYTFVALIKTLSRIALLALEHCRSYLALPIILPHLNLGLSFFLALALHWIIGACLVRYASVHSNNLCIVGTLVFLVAQLDKCRSIHVNQLCRLISACSSTFLTFLHVTVCAYYYFASTISFFN